MYGYIYLTTNLITNEQYIGKHKAIKFDTAYLGSGKKLTEAINIYGKENFYCCILQSINDVPTICESDEQLNTSEKYYINFYNCIENSHYYNMAEGGQGGDLNGLVSKRLTEIWQTVDHKEKMHSIQSSAVYRQKISDSEKAYYTNADEADLKARYLAISKSKKAWFEDELNKQFWYKVNSERLANNPDINIKIANSQKNRFQANPALKEDISSRQVLNWQDPNYRQKQAETRKSESYLNKMKNSHSTAGQKFINNGIVCKMVFEAELDSYLAAGWVLGRLPVSETTKLKMKEAAKNRTAKHFCLKIKCLETNKIFNGYQEIIDLYNISLYYIMKSIKTGNSVFGKYTFVKLEEE